MKRKQEAKEAPRALKQRPKRVKDEFTALLDRPTLSPHDGEKLRELASMEAMNASRPGSSSASSSARRRTTTKSWSTRRTVQCLGDVLFSVWVFLDEYTLWILLGAYFSHVSTYSFPLVQQWIQFMRQFAGLVVFHPFPRDSGPRILRSIFSLLASPGKHKKLYDNGDDNKKCCRILFLVRQWILFLR